MPEYAAPTAVTAMWSTPHVVYTDGGKPSGRPVIAIPGWPMNTTIRSYLDTPNGPGDAQGVMMTLLATGRTVIVSASGSCWGTNTDYPDVGALGRGVIDSAITLAGSLGCDTTTVDLIGVSHGGCVVSNWAWRNPTKVNRIWFQAPGWDLSDIYDRDSYITGLGLPSIAENMRGVYGSADKTAWLAASAGEDPHRNLASLAPIGVRIAAVCATNDEIVDYDGLAADLDTIGATLTTLSSGGHFFARTASEWSDLAALRWFA